VPDPDEAALVAAARQGDKAALAALVSRHRPMLLAVCRGALGNAELAEDAAQEAVLLALTSLDRLRQAERFGPWLAGIGVNVCRRWRRERSRTSWSWEAMQGGRAGEWPAQGPGPAELADAAWDARLVRAAIARLPVGQRAAVTLHYLAGLTQAETAAQTGTSVGAVKVRLHKARARLRERLELWWRETHMPADEAAGWLEMRVADVRRGDADDDMPERHVVLLEEKGGSRRLPIWVGSFEGTALAMALQGAELPRPGPYQFVANLLAAAGGTLREVRVTRLVEGVFYAEAVVDGDAGEDRVDARPSDALTLALVVGVPIRVDPTVIGDATSKPFSWDQRPEDLPTGAREIVREREAERERWRQAIAAAGEQGT
jgi:RNA polymerase sigma factor (sigma-70 family)